MIQGVIFDMDGVLVDSEPFICEAATKMLKQMYDIDVHPDDFLDFVGAGENKYIAGTAAKHGVEVKLPDDKNKTYEIYLNIIKNRLQPLPGVREFISECRNRGIKLAVASAADLIKVKGNLDEIGLPFDTFDAVITGSDVTNHKPNPECFLKAAEALGLPPEQCLVVEDANNGAKAAKSAGAHCLGLTTSFSAEQLSQSGADFIAPHLDEIPDKLMELLKK